MSPRTQGGTLILGPVSSLPPTPASSFLGLGFPINKVGHSECKEPFIRGIPDPELVLLALTPESDEPQVQPSSRRAHSPWQQGSTYLEDTVTDALSHVLLPRPVTAPAPHPCPVQLPCTLPHLLPMYL